MTRGSLSLGLCLLAAVSGSGKEPAIELREETVAGTLRCAIPKEWVRSEGGAGVDVLAIFEGDSQEIQVARYGLPDSRYPAAEAFWKDPQFQRHKPQSAGSVKIGAARVKRWRRRYQELARDPHGPGVPPKRIYEEFVVMGGQKSFWVLSYRAENLGLETKPAGIAVWERFLADVRPEAAGPKSP